MVRQQSGTLLAYAQQLLREHPQLEVVGLILDADAAEAGEMRRVIEKATGQSHAGRGFLGVVPREIVVQMLRACAPATLEWSPPSHGDAGRVLPVFTKGGERFGAVPMPKQD